MLQFTLSVIDRPMPVYMSIECQLGAYTVACGLPEHDTFLYVNTALEIDNAKNYCR